MTLCVVIGVFMLGLMSDALFGSRIHRIETTWQERAAFPQTASIYRS